MQRCVRPEAKEILLRLEAGVIIQKIWLACPVLLFWIPRIWLLAHRGEMHNDPVIFTLHSRGWMSFPMSGVSLALDFAQSDHLNCNLFPHLDRIFRETGGRLYPAKDAHMSSEDFRTFYHGRSWNLFTTRPCAHDSGAE